MRTIEEIYNQMVEEKENNAVLQGLLTSDSVTAVWKLLFYIVAVAIWVHEGIFYAYQKAINEQIENSYPGTLPWYHKKSKEFQYGDTVEIFDNGRVGYSIIDATKQIIKYSAIVEIGNILSVKVAKDNMGIPDVLTIDEESAFANYMKQIKFAGTKLSIVNIPADELIINIAIYYNPQILTADGKLITDEAIIPVTNAINDYIKNITFGGMLVKSKLIDYIQIASGVCDVELESIESKKFDGAYQSISSNAHESISGKFIIDVLNVNYVPCNIS